MDSLNVLLMTILSFLACIMLGFILSKSKKFSYLSDRNNRFGAIDGIRGYLALSVFFHHYVVTYYWKLNQVWQRPPESFFQNLGKVGVAIFFMITGFLFFSRVISEDRTINWFSLYKSRIFRIYPLYLFSLCAISFFVFSASSFEVSVPAKHLLKEYVKWMFFIGGTINDVSDTKTIIAGVDWTLKYEWLFYLMLPIIFCLNRFVGKLGLIFLGLVAVYTYIYPIRVGYVSSEYLIYFAIGAVAYPLSIYVNANWKYNHVLVSTLSLLLVAILLIYPNTLDSFHVFLMAILFILVASGNNIFGILSSRASVLLGEISYSIYLLHGVVLYFIFTYWSPTKISNLTLSEYALFLPIVSLVVVAVSAITFLIIERPAIKAGKNFTFKSLKGRFLLRKVV